MQTELMKTVREVKSEEPPEQQPQQPETEPELLEDFELQLDQMQTELMKHVMVGEMKSEGPCAPSSTKLYKPRKRKKKKNKKGGRAR